jgi:hypothetical protein
MADEDTIWIESTRDPDGEAACLITWGALQCCASVDDVRQTASDLVTCAAYSEMMMTLVVKVKLPASVVSRFATDLLSGAGRSYFGAKTTVTMLPAGSSERQEAFVLLKRGSRDAAISPDEARAMALRWLVAAEAAESDQLVSEALRATGSGDAAQEKLFGYLRRLRDERGDMKRFAKRFGIGLLGILAVIVLAYVTVWLTVALQDALSL